MLRTSAGVRRSPQPRVGGAISDPTRTGYPTPEVASWDPRFAAGFRPSARALFDRATRHRVNRTRGLAERCLVAADGDSWLAVETPVEMTVRKRRIKRF
jgi:hypothetical protein